MSKQKVSIERLMERSDLVAYLEGLIAGFKEGSVVVQQGDKSITLTPPSMLAVEIKAKQKKAKSKFSLELSWRMPEKEEDITGLDISGPKQASKEG